MVSVEQTPLTVFNRYVSNFADGCIVLVMCKLISDGVKKKLMIFTELQHSKLSDLGSFFAL